jgi:hypothetical protein
LIADDGKKSSRQLSDRTLETHRRFPRFISAGEPPNGEAPTACHRYSRTWNPIAPPLADWRAGRYAVYQLFALTIGARLAVADG